MHKKVSVLVVDDSATVRQSLKSILEADPDIRVMATAADPYAAVKYISQETPDVITLDVEMPRMDGLSFLQKIMSQHPIPVVMCSSLAEAGCETTLRALEYGAVEIITKPKYGVKQFLEESQVIICETVKAAALARIKRISVATLTVEKKYTADAIIPSTTKVHPMTTTDKVVVIGASTGGTEALRDVLTKLPPACPGIVVVQHMPEKFTASFAERLNCECEVQVKEAEDGDPVLQGRVLIAPGNRHTLLKRSGARYFVEVRDGELVNRHRPSVDVLFRSTARFAGKNAIGVILTGMGDDGAKGMLEMHEAGAYTIGQDEASCVVYGMPKEAFLLGGVDKVLSLSHIANHIIQMCK